MATVYLAFPEGEDLDATRRRVQQMLRDIEKSGNIGISPLVILRDVVDKTNKDRWVEACFDLLKSCDYMWVMDASVTEQIRREIEFAASRGMEIRFFDNLHWDLTRDKGWEKAEARLNKPFFRRL